GWWASSPWAIWRRRRPTRSAWETCWRRSPSRPRFADRPSAGGIAPNTVAVGALGASDMMRPYRNRTEAGRFLAGRLLGHAHRPDVIVLALPRGGVPVAYEVAKALNAPLDV